MTGSAIGRAIFYGLLLAGLYFQGFGQGNGQANVKENWKLKADKEGIAIYTRTLPDSRFNAVKVECTLTATLSQFVAVILDVNTGTEWEYSTKSSILLKQVSPSELYYYSEVSVPWPVSNRDFIAHLKAVQDPGTKVVTIYGPTIPDYIPEKKDIVRVLRSEGKWIITPIAGNRVKVEYTLRVDPGGNVPAWLINMFATKGPYESFKKLKVHLQKPVYTQARLPFIVN
ncbi:START domain-containing protein [Flavitalea flava]